MNFWISEHLSSPLNYCKTMSYFMNHTHKKDFLSFFFFGPIVMRVLTARLTCSKIFWNCKVQSNKLETAFFLIPHWITYSLSAANLLTTCIFKTKRQKVSIHHWPACQNHWTIFLDVDSLSNFFFLCCPYLLLSQVFSICAFQSVCSDDAWIYKVTKK